MEKATSFETFQFIDGDDNQDMRQLLVLQEDGTLLSVDKDIQYITQTQGDKEVIADTQTCAVFDVSSQQFFVDVDNAPGLIVQEQFAIPEEDRNVYSNSFLIQTEIESKATTEQIETCKTVPDKPVIPTHDADSTSKPANNFTEITLTDAQYDLLEQKGWILLEFGDRVFVLDTLGLHDITNDEKLKEKLKIELLNTSQQNQQTELGEIKTVTDNIKDDVIEIENQPPTQESEFREQNRPQGPIIETHSPNLDEQRNNEIDLNNSQRKCDSIKIKTKYTFSNIPEKVLLGKTVNGKKLYAKITKRKHKEVLNKKNEIHQTKHTFSNARNDIQFVSILQDCIRERPSHVQVSTVLAADTVVNQLMQMPNIRHTVVGNYVVVTKTVVFATEDGKEKHRRRPTVVTGEVNNTCGKFIHIPYMLHNIVNSETTNITKESQTKIITQDFIEFIHVDVTETNIPRKPSVQSINVCNRRIALDVLRDAKKKHPNPIYACGACTAMFKAESDLKEHSENNCLGATDPDDALTIDTDQLEEQSDSYYMLKKGKNKYFSCVQCQAKFQKLFNFKKHVKSHIRPSQDSNKKDSEIKEYKCKMCPSKYFHASSLSKHIMKIHIQGQVNKT